MFRKKIVNRQQNIWRNTKAKRLREIKFAKNNSKSEAGDPHPHEQCTKQGPSLIFKNQGKVTYSNCQFKVGDRQEEPSTSGDEKVEKKAMLQYADPYTGELKGSPPRIVQAPAAPAYQRNTELPPDVVERIRQVIILN